MLVDTMFDLAHTPEDDQPVSGGGWTLAASIRHQHSPRRGTMFSATVVPDSEIIAHRLCPGEMTRESIPEQYTPLIDPPEDAPAWLRYISPPGRNGT